jgi:hypothetical protein
MVKTIYKTEVPIYPAERTAWGAIWIWSVHVRRDLVGFRHPW